MAIKLISRVVFCEKNDGSVLFEVQDNPECLF